MCLLLLFLIYCSRVSRGNYLLQSLHGGGAVRRASGRQPSLLSQSSSHASPVKEGKLAMGKLLTHK